MEEKKQTAMGGKVKKMLASNIPLLGLILIIVVFSFLTDGCLLYTSDAADD